MNPQESILDFHKGQMDFITKSIMDMGKESHDCSGESCNNEEHKDKGND